MPNQNSQNLKSTIIKDYQIPQSRLIGHKVLLATNLMMIVVIGIELIFDLSATTLELLIPSFLLNFVLLLISYFKKGLKNLEIAHVIVLYLIVEAHFFANPSVFYILVYWMPFIPMHALITRGMTHSKWWMLIIAITLMVNGYYGSQVVGDSHPINPDFIKFTSAGILFLFCIYAGFYLLYYLLGNAYSTMKVKNEEIERLNNELKDLNNSLEERVDQRTKDIKVKNERLERIAYMNSHEVRSSLSKIIGASNALKLDENEKERLIGIMVESSEDLDQAIRAMNKEIEKKY
ncbi:hypothetical protein [Ekhidna sp.]|uniref:hypothetical protein n=1 Tax=Ekhidna sp. TaxID=2608089 RepID=UPI003CCBC258